MTTLRLYAPVDEPPPRQPRKTHKLPDFLRAADWDRLVVAAAAEVSRRQAPTKHRAAQRDEMAVHIGLYCGLRISEICSLNVERIDLAEKRLLVFQGKGNKDGFVAIPSKLIGRLTAWINGKVSGPMFLTENGDRLPVRTLCWRLDRLGKLSGLTKHLHCHLLRHSYAVRLLERGVDIRSIQALLRHSSLATTAQYLHCDTSRLQESVERL